MSRSRQFISETARDFWKNTAESGEAITEIFEAAECVLPIRFVFLHDLTLEKAKEWLKEKGNTGIGDYKHVHDRITHGFLITRKHLGVIFINSADSENEQRFTAAHEVGHFMLDHLLPRRRALSGFGAGIKPVLDGERPAEKWEQISALLREIDICPRDLAIEKEGDGSFRSWTNFTAENDADNLALELLAPRALVVQDILIAKTQPDYMEFAMECTKILEEKYRLPAEVAAQYAHSLAYSVTAGVSAIKSSNSHTFRGCKQNKI